MIKLKKISIGFLATVIAVASVLSLQFFNSTHAANTMSNYEVINMGGTTDGLPPNVPVYVYAGLNGLNTVSADGNSIVFESTASNLPGANGHGGLYVYNIKESSISRVDVSTSGVPSDSTIAGSYYAISETGRYVIFSSHGTNLIDGATSPTTDVKTFERDMQTGMTTLLLQRYDGSGSANQSPELQLGVSGDGRFTLLASRYLVSPSPYPYTISYGDNSSGTEHWTTLGVGQDSEANPGSGGYGETAGRISCDGSFAVIQHRGAIQIFDARNNTISQISQISATSLNPSISCNGRYVLYATTNRTDVTPTPTGMSANFHLVRFDRITGSRAYIDSNSTGVFGLSFTSPPSLNAVNYFNASVSDKGDVVLSYKNSPTANMYLKHLSDGSGTLEPIAKNASGSAVVVNNGTISGDGKYIFFMADPYSLGLSTTSGSTQLIRVKTGL